MIKKKTAQQCINLAITLYTSKDYIGADQEIRNIFSLNPTSEETQKAKMMISSLNELLIKK